MSFHSAHEAVSNHRFECRYESTRLRQRAQLRYILCNCFSRLSCDSVSRQEVSEAFCVLCPFLATFLEFAHMTELYRHSQSGVSRINPTSRHQCSNLLLKCGFSCNHCNNWYKRDFRENKRETRVRLIKLCKPRLKYS